MARTSIPFNYQAFIKGQQKFLDAKALGHITDHVLNLDSIGIHDRVTCRHCRCYTDNINRIRRHISLCLYQNRQDWYPDYTVKWFVKWAILMKIRPTKTSDVQVLYQQTKCAKRVIMIQRAHPAMVYPQNHPSPHPLSQGKWQK